MPPDQAAPQAGCCWPSGAATGRAKPPGNPARGPLTASAGGQAAGADGQLRLPPPGGGHRGGLAPGVLGAQDAQPSCEGAQARILGGEGRGLRHLFGAEPSGTARRLRALRTATAGAISGHGPASVGRPAGVAEFFQISQVPVAATANHQLDRAGFRRGPATQPAHGLHCPRGQLGPDHLLDLYNLAGQRP